MVETLAIAVDDTLKEELAKEKITQLKIGFIPI